MMPQSIFQKKIYINLPLESLFWIVALIVLFIIDFKPGMTSLCFFKFIGIETCPGCGIGHSIHSALHLKFIQSFNEHPFGIPAIIIMMNRVWQLISDKTHKLYYEK